MPPSEAKAGFSQLTAQAFFPGGEEIFGGGSRRHIDEGVNESSVTDG